MNKIKNIIFDWGNVLIDVRPENFIEECKKVGVKFTNREVNSTHKAGFFLEHEMGVISDKQFRNEFRLCSSSNLTDEEIDFIWNSMLDFTGRQAYVAVGAADDGKNVHSVVVLFDPSEEWNTLVNTYDYYKEIYSRKYGNPAKSIEKNPSNSNSNISLMYELWQGRVVYGSLWEVEGGSIEISIEKSSEGINEGIVVIKYRDSQNIETKIQKDLEDI